MVFTDIDMDNDIVEVSINDKKLYNSEYGFLANNYTACYIIIVNVTANEPFSLSITTSLDGELKKPEVFENIPVPPEGKLICYKQP